MQGPVFQGEYEVTLDAKFRLLIPSEVRRSIRAEHGEDFFLTLATDNRLPWLYPDKFFDYMATQGQPTVLSTRQKLDYMRLTYALASRLERDKQARILIPGRTLERTVLKGHKELMLIGVFDHLELWPRAEWEKQRETLLARSAEILAHAQQEQT